MVTVDVIVLIINCWREEFLVYNLAMISSKQATASENLFAFVS